MVGIEHDFHPGDGNGAQLQHYWTRDPRGLSKWVTHPHPWKTLYNHLLKFVKNPDFAARLTETYWVVTFGTHSGYRKGKNPLGPG